MRIRLTIAEGPRAGEVFTFEGHDTFIVGRGPKATFRPDPKDRFFSRHHFLIELNPPFCRIVDLNSRNHTHVNGVQIESADLKDGDLIRAGRTSLRVSVEHEPADEASVAPAQNTLVDPPLIPTPSTRDYAPRVSAAQGTKETCVACGVDFLAAEMAGDATVPPWGCLPVCDDCARLVQGRTQLVPGYSILGELGRGGMGIVYRGFDNFDGSPIAIKTVMPALAGSRKQVERFLREASILKELRHPRIVRWRDMGMNGSMVWFSMDLVPGRDASRLLAAEHPLPIGRAVAIVCQLLEALEYAHERGFVHRDIKPGNLLVVTRDGRDQVQLSDFGLARTYQSSPLSGLTMTGEHAGSPPFMAPEQILNFRESQPSVDQYASAATLYNLLTGKFVFDFPQPTRTQVNLAMILNDPPVPIRRRRAEVPVLLADLIHRGLEKEPEDRFENVAEFRTRLQRFQD